MDPSTLIDLPLDTDDIDFPMFMDEMYNITIASPPHDTPHLIEVNSALIHDFDKFAFKVLLVFHYDHDGAATPAHCMPKVQLRSTADLNISAKTRPFKTDSGGVPVAIVTIPLHHYAIAANPTAMALQ